MVGAGGIFVLFTSVISFLSLTPKSILFSSSLSFSLFYSLPNMASHVHLSGLEYFAASCYSGAEVTPPRESGHFHLPPYLLSPSSFIYPPAVCVLSLQNGAIGEQKWCLHHCTNRLSLIKLSCFSYFADGYFHSERRLVMKFIVSQEECYKRTHTQIQSISFLSWWNRQNWGLKVARWYQSCFFWGFLSSFRC